MKKALIISCLLICALCIHAAAEEEPLYPVRENGKWGYINQQGQIVIEPQWAYAEPFDGNTAVVSLNALRSETPDDGLIDRDGHYIIEPGQGYEIINHDIGNDDSYLIEKDDLYGFYDKKSGFYQPPCYESIWDSYGEELIIAESPDAGYGFIRRDTGEVVFPFQFGLFEEVGCAGGYVLAAYDRGGKEEYDWEWGPDYHLFDLSGHEIIFPENIRPAGHVHNGILRVSRELDEEGRKKHTSGWGTVYGLARADGTIIVEPQYDYLEFAGEKLISINLDNKLGLMDYDGKVILPPTYEENWEGPLPYIYYLNGYALIEEFIENRSIILDPAGNELFSHPTRSENGWMFGLERVMENGLVWYVTWFPDPDMPSDDQFGLLRIANNKVEYVTEPVFEDIGEDFSGEYMPVKQNGLWGYIDESAQWIIPPQYEKAFPFQDGLALTEKNLKMAYIDTSGHVIWQEQ